MANELWQLDAVELAGLIRDGRVSAREAVAEHLARLDAVNPQINAVVPPMLHEQALAEAEAADRARQAGDAVGPLHGLPITTKINTDQAGLPTDNGAPVLKDFIANEDSAQVANLRRAGAIVIGRTNAPAFSMRAMTDNALHGMTLNPWNPAMTCGGSSGGAGASIASGIGVIGQGNDIGGSVRWPAYCNGIVGLRPSLGRVPAFNPSSPARRMSSLMMSVQGPLTRSVRDARLALAALAVRDVRDTWWTPAPLVGEPLPSPIRVALVTAVDRIDIDPATVAAVREAGRCLASAGYAVEEVTPPETAQVWETWHPLGLTDLNLTLRPQARESGDPGISRFIEFWFQLRDGADLAGYLDAQVERDRLLRAWNVFMETYPVIVMPSCAEIALPAGSDVQDLDGARRTLRALSFQLILPVLGLPGLAVPTTPVDGLPMGVQIVSRRFREDICLDAGEIIEAQVGQFTPIDPRS
ncbi:MAG: amidase [Thermomicrobiales bacterium]|nr:amidase [Thermomicrobiales bacterium]